MSPVNKALRHISKPAQLPSIISIPSHHSLRNSSTNATTMRTLTLDSLNPVVKNVEYAVRGELAIKAEEYRIKLKEKDHGLPFDKVISSNIGNPQQKGLDQPPITFTRQVYQWIAGMTYPLILSSSGGCTC